jgi:hypothetical protein
LDVAADFDSRSKLSDATIRFKQRGGEKADIMPDAVFPGRREVAFSVLEEETA